MSNIIPEARVRCWLANAPTGDVITYFRGFLALGTWEGNTSLAEADRCQLIRASGYLWIAAQHGRVHLVQVRNGAGDYSYLAIARSCVGKDDRKLATFAADVAEPPS